MATVYSSQKTDWDQSLPSVNIDTREQKGRVRIAFASYEASALQIGDVIEWFNLPNDARILGGRLYYDALGASTTLNVGYTAHTDSDGAAVVAAAAAYLGATSTSSAGGTDVAQTIALGANSITNVNEDGLPISSTLAGGAATGTINLRVEYVVD